MANKDRFGKTQWTVKNAGSSSEQHSLDQLRWRIGQAAQNYDQCRILQKIVMEGNKDKIREIFSEIKPLMFNLAGHVIAHDLIKTLIAHADEEILGAIVGIFTSDSFHLDRLSTKSAHGSSVTMALVERLKWEDKLLQELLIEKLSKKVVVLMRCSFSETIIKSCMKAYSSDIIEPLIWVISLNVVALASDRRASYVLYDCLVEMSNQFRNDLSSSFMNCVYNLAKNAKSLSNHPSGNYIIQWVIEFRNKLVNLAIFGRLSGEFVELSMNKHGYHVVSKLIANCEVDVSGDIITELFATRHDVLRLCEDQYGNLIVLKALKKNPKIKEKILEVIGYMSYTPRTQKIKEKIYEMRFFKGNM